MAPFRSGQGTRFEWRYRETDLGASKILEQSRAAISAEDALSKTRQPSFRSAVLSSRRNEPGFAPGDAASDYEHAAEIELTVFDLRLGEVALVRSSPRPTET